MRNALELLGNAIEEVARCKDALATKDAEIARLEAENERMRGFVSWVDYHYDSPDFTHEEFRVEAVCKARSLTTIPDPAGGMPVEVET